MANYATSALAKAQVKASLQFGANETRSKTPSVMALAVQNSAISIPRADVERVHEKRVVDINFFSKINAGSATAKSAEHTGSIGDSSKVNLVYVSHVETFSLPHKLADNNVFGYEEILTNQYTQAWKNLVQRHDQSAFDLAIASRCQLAAAGLVTPLAAAGLAGAWNGTTFALEIPVADKNLRLQKAEAFMQARYFNGQYDVIADLATNSDFQFLVNQGAGNNQNTAFQFGNSMITKTQGIVSSAYALGAFLILPKGGLAGINWNDPMNKRNENVGGTVGMFTTVADPFGYGVTADLSMYTKRADTSGDTVSGSVQDLLDQYEITLTVAYAVSPLTAAGDGVAHLVGLKA